MSPPHFFQKLPKIPWGKWVKQNFLSQVHLQGKVAPAPSWVNLTSSCLQTGYEWVLSSAVIHLNTIFLTLLVPWQCPHLSVNPSCPPVFILPSIGSSVPALTNKQRLCHLLAGAFIFRVAAITAEIMHYFVMYLKMLDNSSTRKLKQEQSGDWKVDLTAGEKG